MASGETDRTVRAQLEALAEVGTAVEKWRGLSGRERDVRGAKIATVGLMLVADVRKTLDGEGLSSEQRRSLEEACTQAERRLREVCDEALQRAKRRRRSTSGCGTGLLCAGVAVATLFVWLAR